MHLKRREGEPVNAFLYRFSKKVRRSGVLIEAKKRRFQDRSVSKTKRKASALYRTKKKEEAVKTKK
ncbi:MAG: 30S ribosomal protein S21 [Patescibacteria group bacterium]